MAKYLFVFAHPDDETVACSGTIALLCQAGHQVRLLSLTDGNGGEVVTEHARRQVAKLGSVGALRRQELATVAKLLCVEKLQILNFEDGTITNQQVWGDLLTAISREIEQWRPHTVVTFDHTGWYYHLDHIGTSIATTLAVQQVKHSPDFFWHSLMLSHPQKWQYVYAPRLPVTHVVDISAVRDIKDQALKAHNSQNLSFPQEILQRSEQQFELYQLIKQRPGTQLDTQFFQPVVSFGDNQVIDRLITCPE